MENPDLKWMIYIGVALFSGNHHVSYDGVLIIFMHVSFSAASLYWGMLRKTMSDVNHRSRKNPAESSKFSRNAIEIELSQ